MPTTNHADNARRMREALFAEAARLAVDGQMTQAATVDDIAKEASDDTLASLFEIIRDL